MIDDFSENAEVHRSHAPVQADGVTPFDTTQRFEGISYLAVMVGLKYHF